jgi:hypothetical protein
VKAGKSVLTLVSCLAYCATVKMKLHVPPETSVDRKPTALYLEITAVGTWYPAYCSICHVQTIATQRNATLKHQLKVNSTHKPSYLDPKMRICRLERKPFALFLSGLAKGLCSYRREFFKPKMYIRFLSMRERVLRPDCRFISKLGQASPRGTNALAHRPDLVNAINCAVICKR